MPNIETRNEKLDLRLTPSAKRALQVAAIAAHRSVSEFVLESALAPRRRILARPAAIRVERRAMGSLPGGAVGSSRAGAAACQTA